MSVNVADMRAVAKQAREYLSDPERVVLDPDSLFENADGGISDHDRHTEEPARMCFVGALCVATERLGFEPVVHARMTGTMLALCGESSLTELLHKGGPEACVAVIDRYLAATDD